MPPVKKRKKSTSRKKPTSRKQPAARRRSKTVARVSLGDALHNAISRIWSGIVTYVAVGVTVIALVTVLMLAAGGYFFNIGERIDVLSSRAAKAIGFSVSRVSVHGMDEVTDRVIMDALRDEKRGSILGRSLLNLDVDELRLDVEEIPWVRVAAVQKLWPDTVHVTIIEREAIAMWQDQGLVFHLIDREGTRLAVVEDTDSIGLPVLTGTNEPSIAIDILTALADREALYGRVAAVISIEGRRFDLRFRNDFTAKLPENEIVVALDRLEGLGAGTGKLAATLKYLDLRDPRWAYFRPKSS